MKTLLRIYIFHLLSIWIATIIFSDAFIISQPWTNYFIASAILAILNILLKPILKLLFFPINALTLGLFSLVINTVLFYLFYKLTNFITINTWHFSGINIYSINLSPVQLNFWETLFVICLCVSMIYNFLSYLTK